MAENQFETIKRIDDNGKEYWSSCELAKALEYPDYRKFLKVIDKAKTACENSGEVIHNHFVHMDEMVSIGSGAERPVDTICLSRYACYLIVQNSDPTKVVVAKGQTYFAIQTRRQENAENIKGEGNANLAHFNVGQKVRNTIVSLGGTMPEELPTPDAIGKAETRIRSSKKIKK